MSAIRTLIVDDEALCRQGVRLMLADDPTFEIVGECSDGDQAVEAIGRLRPDLLFLDIRMPRGSGFDVVRRVPPAAMPLVVFVTAYGDHAIRAFEVHAIDYILKPFSRTRFQATLEHVKAKCRDRRASGLGQAMLEMIETWDRHDAERPAAPAAVDHRYLDQVKVPDRDGEAFVRVGDIEWFEGADYCVNVHTLSRTYLLRERLKNLERQLPPSRFIRVHKSAIVNVDRVERLVNDARCGEQVVLRSGAAVPVSRMRRAALLVLLETRQPGR